MMQMPNAADAVHGVIGQTCQACMVCFLRTLPALFISGISTAFSHIAIKLIIDHVHLMAKNGTGFSSSLVKKQYRLTWQVAIFRVARASSCMPASSPSKMGARLKILHYSETEKVR